MTLASCQDMEHVVHVAGFWHKASALRIKLSPCCYQKRGIAGGYLQAEFGVHHAGPEMRPKVGPDAFDTHCAGHKRWCHMLVCFLVPL